MAIGVPAIMFLIAHAQNIAPCEGIHIETEEFDWGDRSDEIQMLVRHYPVHHGWE
jgi:hypothetical protein